MASASHGAGRTLSRGEAMRGFDDEFRKFMEEFRVVTPTDLRRPDVRQRPDILAKKLEEIKQEASEKLEELRSVIDDLNDRLSLAADRFTLPAVEVPEPEIDEKASRQSLGDLRS